MTAWERFELGFLNYAVGRKRASKASFKLGPSEYNTKQAQGVFVVLPDKKVTTTVGDAVRRQPFLLLGHWRQPRHVDDALGDPASWFGRACPRRSGTTSSTDWDYAYLTVNGNPVHTNLSTNTNPNAQNFGEGITGVHGGWVDLTADLSAFAGQTVTIGFRYWTDGAQQGTPGEPSPPGFQSTTSHITGPAR